MRLLLVEDEAALAASLARGLRELSFAVDVVVDVVGYYELAASRPAQVVWVAKSGGDFTSVALALASITDNSAARPYLIKVAPGTYEEPGPHHDLGAPSNYYEPGGITLKD